MIVLLSVTANLGSIYLGYILVYVLHDLCIVCLIVYIINFLLLICNLVMCQRLALGSSKCSADALNAQKLKSN